MRDSERTQSPPARAGDHQSNGRLLQRVDGRRIQNALAGMKSQQPNSPAQAMPTDADLPALRTVRLSPVWRLVLSGNSWRPALLDMAMWPAEPARPSFVCFQVLDGQR